MNISPQTSRPIGALLALVAIVSFLPSGAKADTSSAARSVAVSYAHLDLGNAAALDALLRQLEVAAERACGMHETRDLRQHAEWRDCRDAALSTAIAQVVEARIAAIQVPAAAAPVVVTLAAGY